MLLRWVLTRKLTQRLLRPVLFRLTVEPDYAVPDWEYPVFYTRRLISAFGWTLDLHKFVAADPPNDYHSHPYRARRLVLSGGYEEHVMPPNSPVIHREDDKRLSFVEEPLVNVLHEGHGGWVEPSTVHRIADIRAYAGAKYLNSSHYPAFSLWWHGPRTAGVVGYRHEGSLP